DQQSGRDQFGGARSRRRRFADVMIVVIVGVTMPVIIMRRRRVSMTVAVMMIDRIAAGIAPMRAEQRDQPGEDRADQRQKDDCLDHSPTPWSMIPQPMHPLAGESRSPVFRIMLQPFIRLTSSTAI